MEAALIEMQDVTFGYREGGALLSGMTLSLPAGSFHFLTGPSGSGKTSFLRLCYADLLPSSGQMSAFGHDVGSLSRDGIAMLRRKVGVLHQDAQFLDHLPVAENVALPQTVAGQPIDMKALKELLAHTRDTPGVHLIDCPVDYSENDQILNNDIKRLSKEL